MVNNTSGLSILSAGSLSTRLHFFIFPSLSPPPPFMWCWNLNLGPFTCQHSPPSFSCQLGNISTTLFGWEGTERISSGSVQLPLRGILGHWSACTPPSAATSAPFFTSSRQLQTLSLCPEGPSPVPISADDPESGGGWSL